MKVLVAADIHGNAQRYDDLIRLGRLLEAKELWLAGDILPNSSFCYSGDDPSQQQAWEHEIVPKLKRGGFDMVRVIPGNDDFHTPKSFDGIEVYDVPTLVEVDGKRVLFNPWLQHVDWTLYREHHEDDIKHAIFKLVGNSGVDVVIAHQPPMGILDNVVDRFTKKLKRIGSKALCDCVHSMKPKVGVYGHVHDVAGAMLEKHKCRHHNATVVKTAIHAVLIDLDNLSSGATTTYNAY